MDQDEVYEALKEIVPELELKLRTEMEMSYNLKLEQVQQRHQQQIHQIVQQEVHSKIIAFAQIESDLRRQLGMIQRERQQWLKMEHQYRTLIFSLTNQPNSLTNQPNSLISQPNSHLISTNIPFQNQQSSTSQIQSLKWKQNTNQPSKEQTKSNNYPYSSHDESIMTLKTKIESQIQRHEAPYNYNGVETENLHNVKNEHASLSRNSQVKYKNKDVLSERLNTQVLSPPKSTQIFRLRESKALKEASQNNSKMTSDRQKPTHIFWQGENKKKLLSMIRNIK